MHAAQTARGFPGGHRREADPRPALIASIRSSGEISLFGQDPARRATAAKLALAGLLSIEEIGTDGRLRQLTPADVLMASSRFGWRVTLARSRT